MNEFNLNKNYNWETAHNPLVKKYVADLLQQGTDAPVATELFNNTGVSFTYQYIAPGIYSVTASKDIFTNFLAQKTQVAISNPTFVADVAGPSGQSVRITPVFSNVMIILTSDLIVASDNVLGAFSQNAIEITIYP